MGRPCEGEGVNRRQWLYMGILAALWGASYLFIEIALRDGSAPFIVFARTLLGAAVLVPLAAHRHALAPLRGRLGAIAVMASVQVAGPFLLISFGQEHIASGLAGILVSSAPIYTALLAVFVDQDERSHGWSLFGVLIGIVGVALLFGVDLSGDSAALIGGLMVLLAGLGYAVGALYLKRRLPGAPPVGVAAGTMVFAALMTAPLAAIFPPDGLSAATIGALFGLGAGGTGVAFFLFFTLIAEIGPGRASIVAYVAPVFAVIYGAVLLGEDIGVASVVGLVLILGGSYLGVARKASVRAEPEVSRSEPSRSSAPAPARAR
jgi:drug/metabolite transporter (DMT)-like permease